MSPVPKSPRYRVKVRDVSMILEAAELALACVYGDVRLGDEPGSYVCDIVNGRTLWAYRLRCGGVEVRDVRSDDGVPQ